MLRENNQATDLNKFDTEEIEVKTKPVIEQKFKAKDIKGSHDYVVAIRAYLTGETKFKNTRFQIKKDELWYIRKSLQRGASRTLYNKDILARKINGIFIGNSSTIMRTANRERSGRGQSACQAALGQYIPMVPFSVFKDSKLDMNEFVLIDKGPGEELDLGLTDSDGKKIFTHFTGAMLFSIGATYYMFDIDRNDLKLKNFNAWMSRLPGPVKSIAEGYKSLKPAEVYEVEKFLGHEVQRQGEWFFIPTSRMFQVDQDKFKKINSWSDDVSAVLQAKGNRAHYVEQMSAEGYVKGKVTHGGYEHEPIVLKQWCKPVPNTAVESFKISGEVD